MAMPFNHVLAIRDAGSLLPSIFNNQVIVSDCTINALKIDRGFKEINKSMDGDITTSPIEPNPDNLPLSASRSDWSLNTEFYAMFNGDLEAGPLSFYGDEVDSIMIRRTSNRRGFCQWEDLKRIDDLSAVVDRLYNFTFKDKCVESGIIYSYGIQPISNNKRGSLYRGVNENVVYEDIFLLGENGKQLKIRFNPLVSSMRTNIKESRVETLGSKFPFITRNGNVGYREFPLSGLITHFMDKTEDFAPRADLFIDEDLIGSVNHFDMSSYYEGVYRSNGFDDYNNTILEREFRDKVVEFLQDGKPKLLKSPTEGCMTVRIMDVNLTPNPQLGRLVYTFNCNVIEVDEFDLNTMEKYNIQGR